MKRIFISLLLLLCPFLGLTQSKKDLKNFIDEFTTYLEIEDSVDTEREDQWLSWLSTALDENKPATDRQENYGKFFQDIYQVLGDPNPNNKNTINNFFTGFSTNGEFNIEYYINDKMETTTVDQLGEIKKMGSGNETMVLIPPFGFDWTVYQGFINRNTDKFTFICITLPGFGGTPPYPRPEIRRFSNQTWINQVEKALVGYLKSQNTGPVYFMGTQAGAYIAISMALNYPELTKGAISVNGLLYSPIRSFKNPGEMADKEERDEINDKSFQFLDLNSPEYVFGLTFNLPGLYTKDSDADNKILRKQNDLTDVFAYGRFLNELRTTHLSKKISALDKPLLAVVPLHDELSLLSGSFTGYTQWKAAKLDNPDIPLYMKTMKDTRRHPFRDEPAEFDEIIKTFVNNPEELKESDGSEGSQVVNLSPKAEIMQTISNNDIKVEYYRPSVKERKIYGNIVPFGNVWRAGANNATRVTFTRDVIIEGKSIPAGSYTLFVLPEKDKWTFILNKLDRQFGSFSYDEKYDIVRIESTPETVDHVESLKYDFENIKASSLDLTLSWDSLKAGFTIRDNFSPPPVPSNVKKFAFNELLTDEKDDGRSKTLSDAKSLSFHYEKGDDMLWFKFILHNDMNINAAAMNILIDIDANQETGLNWFGTNTAYTFERMITMWVRREGEGYGGFVGVADEAGVSSYQWTNHRTDNLEYFFDPEEEAYYIGIKKDDITPDLKKFNVIGAVGEYTNWNDDIPDKGFATVDLSKY